MNKMIEAGAKALAKLKADSEGVYSPNDYAKAALTAALEAALGDESAVHSVAQEVWDGLSASGLAYEAEERRARLSAKLAIRALIEEVRK